MVIPRVMSTQHPDNATPAPFADGAGVLKGDGEVNEAVDVFALGCDEQMWDSEGKETDNQVVRKLLTGFPVFFRGNARLGEDVVLTLRVPNPRIERDMRKSMVEAPPEHPLSLGCGPRVLRPGRHCTHPGCDSPIHHLV